MTREGETASRQEGRGARRHRSGRHACGRVPRRRGCRRDHHLAHQRASRCRRKGDRDEVRRQGEGGRRVRRCLARRSHREYQHYLRRRRHRRAAPAALGLEGQSQHRASGRRERAAAARHRRPRGDRQGQGAAWQALLRGARHRRAEIEAASRLHRQIVRKRRSRVRCRGNLCAGEGNGMSAQIKDSSIEKFLEELASQNATPGGGSAAAIMGAKGAALVSMVCNLTVGKKKYADVEADMRAVLAKSEALRVKLTGMIEDDVRAFGTVMGAYGMPKETDEQKADRAEAIQKALKVATEVPLACCHASREVIDLAAIAAEKGNLGVISDAGVGVLAAYAALRSAALNVFTNAKMINDRSYAEAKLKEVGQLMDSAERVTEKAYATVKAKVS